MKNVSEIKEAQERKWFVYDRSAQEKMSNYNKMLIEMAWMEPRNWDYEPEAYCIVSTGTTGCWMPEVTCHVDTCDYEALASLVGHLEAIKSKAIARINELDCDDRDGGEI